MGGGARVDGADGVRTVGDIKLLARAVAGIEIKDLKSLADEGKKQVGSGVVAIVGVTGEGKAGIVVGVTPTSRRASTPSTWCARAPRRSAARAAAAGPTWRRPAAPTAPRPTPRSTPSRRRSAADRLESGTTAKPGFVSKAVEFSWRNVHFTSWLRELVPEAPLQRCGRHGRRSARRRCWSQRTAGARLRARRSGSAAQARLHLRRRRAVAGCGGAPSSDQPGFAALRHAGFNRRLSRERSLPGLDPQGPRHVSNAARRLGARLADRFPASR